MDRRFANSFSGAAVNWHHFFARQILNLQTEQSNVIGIFFQKGVFS
jgi:hypothetical protein